MTEKHPDRNRRGAWLALVTVGALVFAVDQLTKALVVGGLSLGEQVPIFGDLVVLWHVQNRGAAFSLFQGELLLFVAVTLVAFGMIIYFHRSLRGQGLWLHAVLGLQLGGATGNLVDRLRQGYVTDFVSVGVGTTRWPTFNVADAALVVGIGVLVVYLSLHDGGREAAVA